MPKAASLNEDTESHAKHSPRSTVEWDVPTHRWNTQRIHSHPAREVLLKAEASLGTQPLPMYFKNPSLLSELQLPIALG